MSRTHVYAGPHTHAAITCLQAGRPDNAANWMERDLGELDDAFAWGRIDPASLVLVEGPAILFQLHADTTEMAGEGI